MNSFPDAKIIIKLMQVVILVRIFTCHILKMKIFHHFVPEYI